MNNEPQNADPKLRYSNPKDNITTVDGVPSHSAEAEIGVLGAILLDTGTVMNTTRDEYIQFMQKIRKAVPEKSLCDLSSEAYSTKIEEMPTHWVLALGEGAEYWDDCHAKGIVRVGWDDMNTDLGNLNETQLKDLHKKANEVDFIGIRDFMLVMKPGDRIFIKRGKRRIIAYGEITAGTSITGGKNYVFKSDWDTYRHIRPAKWLNVGSWDLPVGMTGLPQKTLTLINVKVVRELYK